MLPPLSPIQQGHRIVSPCILDQFGKGGHGVL